MTETRGGLLIAWRLPVNDETEVHPSEDSDESPWNQESDDSSQCHEACRKEIVGKGRRHNTGIWPVMPRPHVVKLVYRRSNSTQKADEQTQPADAFGLHCVEDTSAVVGTQRRRPGRRQVTNE